MLPARGGRAKAATVAVPPTCMASVAGGGWHGLFRVASYAAGMPPGGVTCTMRPPARPPVSWARADAVHAPPRVHAAGHGSGGFRQRRTADTIPPARGRPGTGREPFAPEMTRTLAVQSSLSSRTGGAGRSHRGARPALAAACALALVVVAGCGGGGGGPEEPACTAGVSPSFGGTLDWVAGASGVGSGADGQGGVGIQPALGVSPIVGARVTVHGADGKAIGTADTGADGRVTLKACDAQGPFLVEVEGTATARYFDAAKGAAGASAAFGEGEVLRAVVPALVANIGVTPATEAVAQRLLGRASATASRTLPAASVIDEAYRQVREGAWAPLWPQALSLDTLTALPGQAEAATLADRPADRYALALASLGFAAAQFNATLAAPTLAAARQFAADAADGKLDGRDANGVAVAAIAQAAYDAGTLRSTLDAALAVAARSFASPALRDRLPAVLALGAAALPAGAGGATP